MFSSIEERARAREREREREREFGADIEFQKNPLLGVGGGGPVSAEVGVENVKRFLRRRFSRHRFHLERKSLHARLQLHLHLNKFNSIITIRNTDTSLGWGSGFIYSFMHSFRFTVCVSLATQTATLEEEKKSPFRCRFTPKPSLK